MTARLSDIPDTEQSVYRRQTSARNRAYRQAEMLLSTASMAPGGSARISLYSLPPPIRYRFEPASHFAAGLAESCGGASGPNRTNVWITPPQSTWYSRTHS